jgi:transposase
MHANQKPRRRHSEQFKAQVLAACAERGASVSAVAMSFGLNANLVRQWQRGRGCKVTRALAADLPSQTQAQFLALPLPAAPAAASMEAIRVQLQRGSAFKTTWPIAQARNLKELEHGHPPRPIQFQAATCRSRWRLHVRSGLLSRENVAPT